MNRKVVPIAIAIAVAVILRGTAGSAADQSYPITQSSLSGIVKSQQGELLEGILIRAKKEGGHVALTMVSDAQGKYRFPKLESGRYVVETARADGMEPVRYNSVEIKAGQESHQDFALGPAKEWDRTVSAVDWLLNLPGTDKERQAMSGCVGCHFNNVRNFRFDKEGWLKIVRVMRGKYGTIHYQRWGIPDHAQVANAPVSTEQPEWEPQNQAIAEYLAKVRGPEPFDWSKAKVLPRQKGPATKVIYTEYDIPYEDAEPHDVGVSADGMVFWGDWRWGRIGQLDPKTGEMKSWEVGQMDGKPKVHTGVFQIAFDKDDNPWTTIVWQGGLVKLDRKSGTLTKFMFPDRANRRLIMTSTDNNRSRVWFETDDYYGNWAMAYYEPERDKWTYFNIPFKPGKNESFIYGHIVDSKGNAYALKAVDSDIDRIDGETEKRTRYTTPTPNAFPRRGDYDNEDRIWFAEYNAGQIGMLDPKTGKITEYKQPIPMGNAYSVNVDRRTGLVWAAEHIADRFAALNPKTGEMRDYLLPTRDSQVRIIASYSVGDHSVLWFGVMSKSEGGKIGKMEAWW